MPRIEFFYDLSSPWTYLAFHNIQAIAEETQSEIIWRPLLVGGVFNAINDSVYMSRSNPDSAKMKPMAGWLKEWAELANVPMNFPSRYHPLKSILAMRACCCLEDDQPSLLEFSRAAFDAYFGDAKNLDDPDVLATIAEDCGLNGSELLAKIQQQPIKDRLRANTEEAIARGAFGSPTIFIDEKSMYFGNDQLPLVRQALLRK